MSPQRQRYLDDTYLFEIATTVLEARSAENGTALVLADNIFHPAGGGQPDDQGNVNGHRVTAVARDEDGSVGVIIEATDAFSVGEAVVASIDPDLRKLHAALHTAGHLIDSILRQQEYLVHRASNHRPGQARVEYTISREPHSAAIEELRAELPDAVRELIARSVPVAAGSSPEGTRIVSIGDLHSDPCGGTHVAQTGEISGFELRSLKKKSGLLKAGYVAEHSNP
jgi:Ser-tRNA(Ala) deacylase AlaX